MPPGALNQQLAELFRARHVERTGLELQIRNDNSDVLPRCVVLQSADAGDNTARRNIFRKSFFNGCTQPGETNGVGCHEGCIHFLEIGEEAVDDRPRRNG